jgi:hypothetical protein
MNSSKKNRRDEIRKYWASLGDEGSSFLASDELSARPEPFRPSGERAPEHTQGPWTPGPVIEQMQNKK